MTPTESRTLAGAAVVLAVAALLRAGLMAPAPEPVGGASGADVSSELLAGSRARVAAEARRSTPLEPGERIDPNRATEVELDRLPGVGPSLAGAIASTRAERGGFAAAEDLLRVPGIGAKTLARIRPHLDLSGTAAPPGSSEPLLPTSVLLSRGQGGRPRSVALNGATPDELESLPGIGPVLARRIVAHRTRAGRFVEVDELLDVPGIGPVTLERIRPLVAVR